MAETRGLAGIGPDELLAGVPYAHIVNAAFCHPHPDGSRFSGPDRGAWYASLAIATAQAEVASCFRPAIVTHVRRGETWTFIWEGGVLQDTSRERRRPRR